MDSKKIIETLVKIANNQQKIIHKLAQQALPPDALPSGKVEVTEGKHQAPATDPKTGTPGAQLVHKDPATALTQALGQFYNKALNGLSVDVNKHEVNVSFKPGAATQANYDHVLATVQKLQNNNSIVGGPYKVKAA